MPGGKKIEENMFLIKETFFLVIRNNLLISLAYLMIIPFFRGISNLDLNFSAECLEKSVSLVGIILIVPLLKPEQDNKIRELIYLQQYARCIIMRILLALLILLFEIVVFSWVMIVMNCTFDYFPMVVGVFISALALGSGGFLAQCITNSVVIGYLVSIGFYLCSFLGLIHKTHIMYLFSITDGQVYSKYFLLILSIIVIMIGIFLNTKKYRI